MAEDLVEGYFTSEMDAKEDHAGYPEEEDIPPCFKECTGVERLEVGSLGVKSFSRDSKRLEKTVNLVGPAHDGEGPQTRGEPCIKDVFVLF